MAIRSVLLITLQLIALLCSLPAQASGSAYLLKGQASVVIQAEYFADREAAYNVTKIQSLGEENWRELDEEYANFGYQESPYWYRFRLTNPRNETVKQVVEINYPLIDYVDFYRFDDRGNLIEAVHTGDRLAYSQRPVDHPHFLFPVKLKPGEQNVVYLRALTSGSQLVPLILWDDIALLSALADEGDLHAIYFGMVLVIAFLNVLIFFAFGEKMYLYYAGSVITLMLFFAILRGKLYPYVMSDSPEFHHWAFLLLIPISTSLSALFVREFLNIRSYSATINSLINLILFVQATCLVSMFLFERQTALQFTIMTAVPCSFVLLIIGPILAWMGNRMALVYSVAWSAVLLGATLTALSKQGVIASHFVTEYGMQVGSAIEVFILTGALVYRFYIEHKQRIEAQALSLQESTERREAELKLLDASMMHPVTLMPNRLCFEQSITEAIRKPIPALMVITIEHKRFPELCKTLGQQNADLMLCELASRYNDKLSDVPGVLPISGPSFKANLCSLENGSFGVLMDQRVVDKHRSKIRRMMPDLLKPIPYKDMVLELQPSIGVASYPEQGVNAATLMRHSEVAADFAENASKTMSYYRPELDQYNARRLTMISELKEAIAGDDLSLFLQPKLSLAEHKIVGVEALIRWRHKKYGMVRPDEFIPMAEQTGIIRELTRWVIDEALHLYNQVVKAGYDLQMSINLSAINLRESDLIDYLNQKLDAHQVAPENICLELTETSMMSEPKRALKTLSTLRGAGIQVSVDDFGSGYSSLSYLKELPATEIKLDKSLVLGLGESQRNTAVVRSTIDMCHELGFKVVAEGVESAAEMEGLALLGCDLVQGYHLTPPLSLEHFLAWIEEAESSRRFAS